jgi:glycosyltransferase involved in cell wall biosynthesis
VKILINAWHDLESPRAGGSEVVVDRLATELTLNGNDVTLSVPGPIGNHAYKTIRSGGFYSQFLRAPFNYFRTARNADVVIDVINGLPFFTPLWRRKKPTIAFIHHIHDEQWSDSYGWFVATVGRFLELRIMPRVYSEFITVSNSTKEDLERHGVDPSRITVVPNGVDEAPPGIDPTKSETPLFVAVARLVPNKRIEKLLSVWAEVQEQTGGRLVIIGSGPLLDELQGDMPPNCEFLGHISDDKRDQLLASSWLHLMTSRREGWGLVILEAARVATPTLAMNVPGVRDAIVNEKTGILAESRDEMIKLWIELAGDPAHLHELGEAALIRSRSFTWTRSTQGLEQVLQGA